MNSALKWKLIAGFLLVFIAGGAAGVFVTMTMGHQFMFGPHQHGFVAQTMKSRLRWQLKLTDEQMTKISPIVEKTTAQLEEIRGDTGKRVRDVIVESHRLSSLAGHTAAPLPALACARLSSPGRAAIQQPRYRPDQRSRP